MTTTELKNIIDQIIAEAFETVQKMYSNKEYNHIIGDTSVAQIFPQYSSGRNYSDENMTRVSEQELRFAFVQAFQEYRCKHNANYLYGIEVPTKDKYLFTIEDEVKDKDGNKKKKRIYKPRIDKENGRSGSFDMVIFNEKLERACLIEFKYNHPEKGSFAKDFLKLANLAEGDKKIKRYFIHLVKDKASDEEKIKKNAQDGLSVSIESVIYKPVILNSKYKQ